MRRLVFACLLALFPVPAAFATVGGPTLCEVLGYEARTQRVYFTLTSWDESGAPERVLYFDLASGTPARPLPLPEPKYAPGTDVNRARAAELAALRRKLAPLAEDPQWTSFVPIRGGWQPFDSLRCEDGMRPRYVATVSSGRDPDQHPVRMTSLDNSPHALRQLRSYRLPQDRRSLVIWSAELDPWEGGYEIQLPVMLGEHRGRPDPIAPEAYGPPR